MAYLEQVLLVSHEALCPRCLRNVHCAVEGAHARRPHELLPHGPGPHGRGLCWSRFSWLAPRERREGPWVRA